MTALRNITRFSSFGVFCLMAGSLLLSGCSSTGAKSSKSGYLVIAHGSAHHHDGHPGHGKPKAQKQDHSHHGHHGHHAEQEAKPDPRVEQLSRPWEQSVLKTVSEAAPRMDGPVEVAFGMWDHISFQRAVDRLTAQGIRELQVIPLFVNSNSSVISGQKYQFGVIDTQPESLPPLTRVKLPENLKLKYGYALDESLHLSKILTDRAQDLANNPSQEELILVAHGPVGEEENKLWVETLQVHADRINENFGETPFAKTHIISLRDDAGKKVRDAATREFRAVVSGARKAGREAIVLPVLIAKGGIDRGIGERLKGLKYRYKGDMIAPDPELANWIADSAAKKN